MLKGESALGCGIQALVQVRQAQARLGIGLAGMGEAGGRTVEPLGGGFDAPLHRAGKLRGEPVDAVSREVSVPIYKLEGGVTGRWPGSTRV